VSLDQKSVGDAEAQTHSVSATRNGIAEEMTTHRKKMERVLVETFVIEAQLKKSIQKDRKVIREPSK